METFNQKEIDKSEYAAVEASQEPDIFVEDQSYKSIKPIGSKALATTQTRAKRESLMPKVLISSFLMTLLTVLSIGFLLKISSLRLVSVSAQEDLKEQSPLNPLPPEKEQAESEPLSMPDEQPVSLAVAQNYFDKSQYAEALAVYEKMQSKFTQRNEPDVLNEFIQLNKAICLQKSGDEEQALNLLKPISLSDAPLLRVLSNYHLSVLESNRRQFLESRSRAYQAMALLDVLKFKLDWALEQKRNLDIMAAQSISKEAISGGDSYKELPEKIWLKPGITIPPLQESNEQQLQDTLNNGTEILNEAALGPLFKKTEIDGHLYWNVSCNGASISELISRFAHEAGYDVRWQNLTDNLRNKPVTLYFGQTDERQFVRIAAGCAGLVASIDGKIITLTHPAASSSSAEYLAILSAEAVACWEKYLLDYYDDKYLPNAHLMLGFLKSQQGLESEALEAFKMAAGRFLNSEVGPYALSASAEIKSKLFDYHGAYDDLNDAVEQFPEHEGIDQTYCALATAAKRIGNSEQAAKIYAKVYYMSISPEMKASAAFEAGKIFYEAHNFAEAEKWLSQYVEIAHGRADFHQACLYLGKIWLELNKFSSASGALEIALTGQLSQQDYVETVTALAEGYIEQGNFVKALELLKNATLRQLSQEQTVSMIILESRVLRGMGLTDKAEKMLNDKDEYIINSALKAQIRYELSECYVEEGNLELAHKKLTDILEKAGSSPIAHKAALKLIEVCFELGLDDQSINVGQELLNMNPGTEIERKTVALIAAVYNKKQDYDRAAMVMMGQWK